MNDSSNMVSLDEPTWDDLTPQQFERFTYELVRGMSFEQVQIRSGTGDGGEDVTAYHLPMYPSIAPVSRKWVFQCKKAKRIARIGITQELSHFVGQDIDTWVLVTTAKPTTQLRQWLDRLSSSREYRFYIQAWWRMDLNLFVRKYRTFLIQNLPPHIIETLRLFEYLKYSRPTALDVVLAKCRNFTNTQVRRFARSKYIKGLYVHRKSQEFLGKFHSPEAQLAKRFKARLIDVIAQLTLNMTEAINALSSLRSALKQFPVPKALAVADGLLSSCKTIQVSLDNLLSNAHSLSDITLLDQQSHHAAMIEAVHVTITLIKRAVGTEAFEKLSKSPQKWIKSVPGSSQKRIIVLLQQTTKRLASCGVLGFNTVLSRLRNTLAEIERALRHCVIIIDRAGGGKTSLLCDFALAKSTEAPTVLLFGKETYQHSNSLIQKIEGIVAEALEPTEVDPMEVLDKLLKPVGLFLNVFIDGINENRRISELDSSLIGFLEWSKCHRIRVTITCRDIYWDFFDSDKWKDFIYDVRENELYQFTIEEYVKALPLYMEHFHIKCELAESALDTCRHPLLLRFFCEAYGDPDGSGVRLGKVRDIRLKELFDEYYNRKLEQIRLSLGHNNIDAASRFLLGLADYLYRKTSTSLLTYEIEGATGYSDTSTKDSMYLRFLDEDIILEEDPIEQGDARRVSFVYEEFMEYVLALSSIARYHRRESKDIYGIFGELRKIVVDWVNARGVVEYLVIMLLGGETHRDVKDGFRLLKEMMLSGRPWVGAFWSAVGKLPDKVVDSRLFDLLYPALCETQGKSWIRNALLTMSRYNVQTGERLVSALLWSATLPNVLRWAQIEKLSDMSNANLDALANQLTTALQKHETYGYLEVVHTDQLLQWVLLCVNTSIGDRIRKSIRLRGKPGRTDFIGLMHIVRDLFPEQQAYLLNGLFHTDNKVASFCANRIRFVKKGRPAIAFLCQRLASVEKRSSIRNILLNSAEWMIAGL